MKKVAISSFTSCLYKKNKIPNIIKSSIYSLIPKISKIACSEFEDFLQSIVLLISLELVILFFCS